MESQINRGAPLLYQTEHMIERLAIEATNLAVSLMSRNNANFHNRAKRTPVSNGRHRSLIEHNIELSCAAESDP